MRCLDTHLAKCLLSRQGIGEKRTRRADGGMRRVKKWEPRPLFSFSGTRGDEWFIEKNILLSILMSLLVLFFLVVNMCALQPQLFGRLIKSRSTDFCCFFINDV